MRRRLLPFDGNVYGCSPRRTKVSELLCVYLLQILVFPFSNLTLICIVPFPSLLSPFIPPSSILGERR